MPVAAVRESVTVAGRPDRVRVARAFVGAVLGPGHPCGEVAVLLASELFANSVRQSRSGVLGETVTLRVTAAGGAIRIEVTDRSGPGVPRLRPAGCERKAAGAFSSWRRWPPGGAGGVAAGGR